MVGGEGLPNLQFGTSDELRPCGQLHEEPNCAGTFICISLDGRRRDIDHAILLKDCRRQRAAAPRCTHGTFPVGRLARRARRAVGAARASKHLAEATCDGFSTARSEGGSPSRCVSTGCHLGTICSTLCARSRDISALVPERCDSLLPSPHVFR
ncbi:hypothetical protein K466DRAFT_216046 [Polyporus arcularius HHB13444]|uniref:Uncharacterized protein n=1 Tax=Polyporus arcularius HHB13444 TaxID=1314778 RepID=A0A5C3P4W3_9APHY|nr:hypothetical protein K466DRAFT_216046 [Polyporus arcularius HHB13444]